MRPGPVERFDPRLLVNTAIPYSSATEGLKQWFTQARTRLIREVLSCLPIGSEFIVRMTDVRVGILFACCPLCCTLTVGSVERCLLYVLGGVNYDHKDRMP